MLCLSYLECCMKSETALALNITDEATRLAGDQLPTSYFEDPAGGGGIATARPDVKETQTYVSGRQACELGLAVQLIQRLQGIFG